MRVLVLSSNWPPVGRGGAETYVAALAERLRAAGDVVGAVTLGVPGDDVVEVVPARPHRLDQHRAAPRWQRVAFHARDAHRPQAGATIARAIARFRPHVVHSHVVAGMSIAALQAPARQGVPHVHTLHDHWLTCWRSTGTTRRLGPCGPACRLVRQRRLGALHADAPHVLVGISRDVLTRHTPVPPGVRATRVVHHPADVAASSRPQRGPGPVTFGYLGQLNPTKGVSVLLDAATRLGRRARVVVAGAGRLEDRVRAAAGPALDYLGWVTGADREAFFADIDCLVVPSIWAEPAGLVAREAAARGLPVIASAAGGLPEYVPAASRPLLVPPGDVAALVAAMEAVLAAPEAYRPAADEVPTWADHLATLRDVYDRARALAPSAV